MSGDIRHLDLLAGDGAFSVAWWADGDVTFAGEATMEPRELLGALEYMAEAIRTGLTSRLPVPAGLAFEVVWDAYAE